MNGNFIYANVVCQVTTSRRGSGTPIPQEPDAWLWEDGDTVAWDDGTELLLEEVQQD